MCWDLFRHPHGGTGVDGSRGRVRGRMSVIQNVQNVGFLRISARPELECAQRLCTEARCDNIARLTLVAQ